jgi:hypothetical protein
MKANGRIISLMARAPLSMRMGQNLMGHLRRQREKDLVKISFFNSLGLLEVPSQKRKYYGFYLND